VKLGLNDIFYDTFSDYCVAKALFVQLFRVYATLMRHLCDTYGLALEVFLTLFF
jgi:hypothetical protein